MFGKRSLVFALVLAVLLVLVVSAASAQDSDLTPKEELGKSIYFDTNLSINSNQACAACHAPESGWTGPIEAFNAAGAVYEGSISGRFGNRKPPSAAYATLSPILYMDKKGTWIGGNFWDGRATGQKLGNPAADQAQGPFLNPREQGLPDSACVVYRVCSGSYAELFEDVWGAGSCAISWPGDIETTCATEGVTVDLSPGNREKSDTAYDNIALSIAAFEASPEVNAFSSKFDLSFTGAYQLTAQERVGYAIFMGKGKCTRCHPGKGPGALFTDYTYDNLGVPKNPENPVYDYDPGFIDTGLGGYLESAGYDEAVFLPENGKVKVPTLRNVDLRPSADFVKAYSHNGYFKSLEGIVHFYNTRDVLPTCPGDYTEAQALAANCWPAPEVAANVNTAELGDLGLSPDEEAALVAFLKTLSDGHVP